VYVLKGAVRSALGKEPPPKTYTEGQSWSEQPMREHRISRNASQAASAELLVFFVVPHETINLSFRECTSETRPLGADVDQL
jgi:quercetin dioxygenase-like cupin family protein